jgi:hypothetical protein
MTTFLTKPELDELKRLQAEVLDLKEATSQAIAIVESQMTARSDPAAGSSFASAAAPSTLFNVPTTTAASADQRKQAEL